MVDNSAPDIIFDSKAEEILGAIEDGLAGMDGAPKRVVLIIYGFLTV